MPCKYEQHGHGCRAALLDALQKVGMRWRPMRQRWACNILLSTYGRDLTRLKSWVDDGDDYQTLYKMVYNDFQGESQRSVLQHISTQGQQALQEMQAVAPTAPPGVCLKVRSHLLQREIDAWVVSPCAFACFMLYYNMGRMVLRQLLQSKFGR